MRARKYRRREQSARGANVIAFPLPQPTIFDLLFGKLPGAPEFDARAEVTRMLGHEPGPDDPAWARALAAPLDPAFNERMKFWAMGDPDHEPEIDHPRIALGAANNPDADVAYNKLCQLGDAIDTTPSEHRPALYDRISAVARERVRRNWADANETETYLSQTAKRCGVVYEPPLRANGPDQLKARDANDVLREDGEAALRMMFDHAKLEQPPSHPRVDPNDIGCNQSAWMEIKRHNARDQAAKVRIEEDTAPKPDTHQPAVAHLILSSADFVAGFVPPDYVLEGVLQRRFLYSLTGKTGAGKTAIMLLLAAHVALGNKISDRDVEPGKVLYFAGENADDVRMRWIAMAQQMDFDIDAIDVNFISGVFKFSEMSERIRAEIKRIGDVALIMIDTSAAYFEGDNENDNKQHGDHARRTRAFTGMPGRPCVITACHPVKNATDDNLIPRGGGAFLNEVDGNLTASITEGSVEVHTQGKFRGPDFAPLNFLLRTVTHEKLKDSKGRLIPTVVASMLTEQAREDIAKVVRSRQDELLIALLDPANQKASRMELARRLGWEMKDGRPYHVLVGRILKALVKEKFAALQRDQITLTKKGKEAALEISKQKPQ
jgi:hypothetical protein